MKNFQIAIPLVLLGILFSSFAYAQTPFEEVAPGGTIKVPNLFGTGLGGPAAKTTFGGLVTIILQIALLIVGSIAVAFLVYGGYRYLMSGGNEEATEAAKKIITNAILGLVIVILSFAIITIIARILITGTVAGPGP